jgi:mannitol-specific phosphotransferase system IIBC component
MIDTKKLSSAIIMEGTLRDRAIERLCKKHKFKIENWLDANELKEWEKIKKTLYGEKAETIQVWPNTNQS